MNREQLNECRENQRERYPLLCWVWARGDKVAIAVLIVGFLGGLFLIFTGANDHSDPRGVFGFVILVGSIAGYVNWLIAREALRVFLDIEIHVRRFVDGD